MIGAHMPAGYTFLPEPNDVARRCCRHRPGRYSALICDIELFSQAHYRSSIEPDGDLDPLWKDVFLFHWREESQHAILDELEWQREDARIDEQQRDRAVDDLIGLVGAVDGIVQMQAKADAEYFATVGRPPTRAMPRSRRPTAPRSPPTVGSTSPAACRMNAISEFSDR